MSKGRPKGSLGKKNLPDFSELNVEIVIKKLDLGMLAYSRDFLQKSIKNGELRLNSTLEELLNFLPLKEKELNLTIKNLEESQLNEKRMKFKEIVAKSLKKAGF